MRHARARRAGTLARAVALALVVSAVGGCADAPQPEPRRTPAPPDSHPDPERALAYLADGAIVVRAPARGAPVSLRAAEGDVTAFAWTGDGRGFVAAVGLDLVRIGRDGAPPARVLTLRDEANERIVRLEPALERDVVVAMTAGPPGPEAEVDARFWRVELAAARAFEISARDFGMLAADPGRYTSDREAPLVDPTGRWELRVVSAGPGAGEAIVVTPAGGGRAVTVADAPRLPVDALGPEDGRYTGRFADAAWVGGSGAIAFVAEAACEEVCLGPVFAVGADGSNLRRLSARAEAVPRTWNGTEGALEEADGAARRIVLVDALSGGRVDLGAGAAPRWAPLPGAGGRR